MLIEFPPPLWIMLDESHAVDAADGPSWSVSLRVNHFITIYFKLQMAEKLIVKVPMQITVPVLLKHS